MLERLRKRLTSKQTKTLEKRFQGKPYLKPEEKRQLAKSLIISEKFVQTWFLNRRYKSRKYGLQYEGENSLARYRQCYTHTHTHTHTHTQTYTHNTHTYIQRKMHTHTNKHTQRGTPTCTHTYTNTRVQRNNIAKIHINTYRYTQT